MYEVSTEEEAIKEAKQQPDINILPLDSTGMS